METSYKGNIKKRNVDFYVYDSPDTVLTSIVEDDDHGKLNVVATQDGENNGLYLGNAHIASGWGFTSLETLSYTENFIKNPKIKSILDADILNWATEEYVNDKINEINIPESQSQVSISDSFLKYHNDEISFTGGLLKGKSSINVYDGTTIVFTNGEKKGINTIYDSLLNDDALDVSQINLHYDILDSATVNKSIKYRFIVESTRGRYEKPLHNINVNANGLKNELIINVESNELKIEKNFTEVENITKCYINFTDNESFNETFDLFSVIYRYKIYASINTSNSSICDEIIYYKDKDNELKINTSTDIYAYMWVPVTVNSNSSLPVIYKNSSIATEYQYVDTLTKDDINYRIYKSPQMYRTNTAWIVK